MIAYDNTINTLQNRTFSYDTVIQYVNGDPFIVSSEYVNPYIVFSLASSKFVKDHKYFKRWWDAIDDPTGNSYPRFYQTTPQIVNSSTLSNTFLAPYFVWPEDSIASDEQKEHTTCVFNYNGEYFYYKKVEDTYVKEAYSFKYNKSFDYDTVKEFEGLDYVYDLAIIDGETNMDYLVRILNIYKLDVGGIFQILDSGKLQNIAWYNGDEDKEAGWYIWEGAKEFDDTFTNNAVLISLPNLLEFAKSPAAFDYISDNKKSYIEDLKLCNPDLPITLIRDETYIIKPTEFNVLSVVKGRINGKH